MRQWDTDSGVEIQRCDLKCGNDCLTQVPPPYLSAPLRMSGAKWIGVAFDDRTEKDVVFRLFDRALSHDERHGCTIVLASQLPAGDGGYRETALPFSGNADPPKPEPVPEKLRQMRRMFEYGRESAEARARSFYRQAVFMRDYEDNVPWSGEFFCYFPTYRDMTTRQLRGYFTWRKQVREGQFRPIATSAAYVYIYELLNGVGAGTADECLQKLIDFETGYLNGDSDDARMRANLRRWMLEFAVLNGLPPETAEQAADPELVGRDRALAVLKKPESYSDDDVFSALCRLGGKRLAESPVISLDPSRGKRLFCEIWRAASAYKSEGKNLFTLCFGKKKTRRWYPLANAVYLERARPKDLDYILNDCRTFRCRHGVWQVIAYDKLAYDKAMFQGLLHEADARLRRYLKTGRYLRENPADAWAAPYVDTVIEADKKAVEQAAKPVVTIDLSGLERIRRDAAGTRDSLLTEEEQEEFEVEANAEAEPEANDLPLDPAQLRILRALLRGEDVASVLRANHMMPSITADFINEALFDEIGDSVLLCEDDRLLLVEDYMEDLERMLGG